MTLELLQQTSAIELIPIPPIRQIEVQRYATADEEARAAVAQIMQLLEQGVEASDIVIGVAAIERYAPVLRSAAALCSLPLTMQYERPVADYAPGALLIEIGQLISEDWNFSTMRSLYCNPAIPWREAGRHREIVQHCMQRGIPRGADAMAKWLPAETRRYFRELRAELLQLYRAGSAAVLHRTIGRFATRYLEVERWDATQRAIWTLIISLAAEIHDVEARVEVACRRPMQLLTSLLQEQQYVPSPTQAGIAVYPYRAAAGSIPAHHFSSESVARCDPVSCRFVTAVRRGSTGRVRDRGALAFQRAVAALQPFRRCGADELLQRIARWSRDTGDVFRGRADDHAGGGAR